MNPLKTRLQNRVDRREIVQSQQEAFLAERGDDGLSETDKKQVDLYRSELAELDTEIEQLISDAEAQDKAEEMSKKVRRAALGAVEGTDVEEDGVVYRTMAAYARDVILTRTGAISQSIAGMIGDKSQIERASQRLELLKRVPEHTLSSDVLGLSPPQHIAQIFQVIDDSRPIVASSTRVPLERGKLTYPAITGRPTVADQGTEKTVASTPDLNVEMEEATATTYNAGGNLSWQAINWTTPSALDLWFRVVAADYALVTETDAGEVLIADAQANDVDAELDGTPTYEEYVAAIAAGAGKVYDATGRMADTLYFAPDEFFKFAALIPTGAAAAFLTGGLSMTGQNGSFAGLRMVVSRGLASGVSLVGDSDALLVAETAGAPVELRAVEAQIGGLEVGIIGAFEAVVADPGAFSSLTAAS